MSKYDETRARFDEFQKDIEDKCNYYRTLYRELTKELVGTVSEETDRIYESLKHAFIDGFEAGMKFKEGQ